jgi:thymidine kinase
VAVKPIGVITVFTGPMFSGKTEALLVRLSRAKYAKKKILVVKPHKDLRTVDEIVSRRLKEEEKKFQKYSSMSANTVGSESELIELVNKTNCQIIGADECQFFPDWFVSLTEYFAWRRGIDLVLSGLDIDAWRRPFGIMPQLIAIADEVQKFRAICFKCGKEARFTQKLTGSKEQIEIGDADKYEARCGDCYVEFK